jgi:hypothetical protein
MVIEPSGQMEKRVVQAAKAADAVAAASAAPAKAAAKEPAKEKEAARPKKPFSPTTTQDVEERAAAAATLPVAKLQVLSGTFAGRELKLNKALTTLGRPGVQVAAITRRAEGYFIVHVESGEKDNFPLVNGMSIGPQARVLNDNDVIQLAGVKMGFFLT